MDADKGYSPEVAEILSRKPRWVIRHGILLVGLIFALCLAGTWFIPYPLQLGCQVTFSDGSTTSNEGTVFTGAITLPLEYERAIEKGTPVRITLAATGTSEWKSVPGKVESVSAGNLPEQVSLTAVFVADPRTADAFLSASKCNGQITVGRSNLLKQIFNPVITLIRRAGTDRTKRS